MKDDYNSILKIILKYVKCTPGDISIDWSDYDEDHFNKLNNGDLEPPAQFPAKEFEISLKFTKVSLNVYKEIFSVLQGYSILDLSGNEFGERKASELARVFAYIPHTVQILRLSLSDIAKRTDEELLILAKSLPHIKRIEFHRWKYVGPFQPFERSYETFQSRIGKKLIRFINLWHKERTHEIYSKIEDRSIPSDPNLLIQQYMMDGQSTNVPQFKDIQQFIKAHKIITKNDKITFQWNCLYALSGISTLAVVAGIIACFLLPIAAGVALIGLGVVGGAIAFGLFKHGSVKQTASTTEDNTPASTLK